MAVPLSPRTWAMLSWKRVTPAGPNAGWRLLAALPSRPAVASALTQDLGVRVASAGQGDDSYWSSGTSGAQPLVIGGPR
jgi:hypothetical protein